MNLDSEAPVRNLSGAQGALGWVLATGLSVYSLVWVITIVEPQIYRVSFLLLALILTFLLYPAAIAPFHYWSTDASGRCLWYPSVVIVTAPELRTWAELLARMIERLDADRA